MLQIPVCYGASNVVVHPVTQKVAIFLSCFKAPVQEKTRIDLVGLPTIRRTLLFHVYSFLGWEILTDNGILV